MARDYLLLHACSLVLIPAYALYLCLHDSLRLGRLLGRRGWPLLPLLAALAFGALALAVGRASEVVADAAGVLHVASLEARIKAYLKAGERDTAAKFALELQKAKKEHAENEAQLKLHETAYNNNVTKVKHATKKLSDLKNRIKKYDAELKLSRAEAELAKLAQSFNFDVTTDFGQIEDVIQDKIGLNRAKVRVAADLSGEGLEDIKREEAVEESMAADALREFEIEMGMVTPETAGVKADDKELGTQRVEQTAG